MKITSLFLTAATALVLSVGAIPNGTPDERALAARGSEDSYTDKCPGNKVYSGWGGHGSCECPKSLYWRGNSCRRRKPQKPKHQPKETCYCAKGRDDYREYSKSAVYFFIFFFYQLLASLTPYPFCCFSS
jgi:hypothetical protein